MDGHGEIARLTQAAAGAFGTGSAFPPIAEYAFLSDCEVTALVAPSRAYDRFNFGVALNGRLDRLDIERSGSCF